MRTNASHGYASHLYHSHSTLFLFNTLLIQRSYGLFKPMRLEPVASAIGPAQFSMSWDSEYYGGGTTWIKFTQGVPMKGVESTQFVGTTATGGDFLVASPGNGNYPKWKPKAEGTTTLLLIASASGLCNVRPHLLRTDRAGARDLIIERENRKYNHGRRGYHR